MVNIFVYGTLKPDQPGYEWVLKQKPTKTLEITQSLGCLLDFGLYELEGLPLISPSPGSKVHGYVLELTSTLTSDATILSLFDEYEGIKMLDEGKDFDPLAGALLLDPSQQQCCSEAKRQHCYDQ